MTFLQVLTFVLIATLIGIQVIRHKFRLHSDAVMAQLSAFMGASVLIIVLSQTGLWSSLEGGTFGSSLHDWILALLAAGGVPIPLKSSVTKSGNLTIFSGDPADLAQSKKTTVLTLAQLVITVLFKIFKW